MEALKAKQAEQANKVRELKEKKADKKVIEEAVAELKKLKEQLAEEEKKAVTPEQEKARKELERREKFDNLLRRKMFVIPSFEIYGGVAGLFDYGPPGCAVMQNIQALWRQHFVLHEEMLEMSGPAMTPAPVLVASGHVARFTDFMAKDEKTGDCYRVDKLIEATMEKLLLTTPESDPKHAEYKRIHADAGAMKPEQLDEIIARFNIRSDANNPLGKSYPFNLMFETSIGPTGKLVGYLRPETAQGIFVNFRHLLEYNAGKMPFAAAQIGSAFRNEIAPRSGLIRVREFTLAEIEHFVDPEDKSHPKFKDVANIIVQLLSQDGQDSAGRIDSMTFGEAVARGVINNETLGYFLGRTYLFLTTCGIKHDKLRFRQHRRDEMAHYAADCWDAEIYTTYGWVECVGHADRSAFDLTEHQKASKKDLLARRTYSVPKEVEEHSIEYNFPALNKKFAKQSTVVRESLSELKKEHVLELEKKLQSGPAPLKTCEGTFELEPGMFKVKLRTVKKHVEDYVPGVIEPSFGLGRILYAVLEHAFDDEMYDQAARTVLHLPPIIAPVKAGVLPLSANDAFDPFLATLARDFVRYNVSSKVDNSSVGIGRKYARADELGIPFCVTVDFDTVKDNTVTIRNRDTTEQVRVKIDETPVIIHQLCTGVISWPEVYAKYPKYLRPVEDEKEEKSDKPAKK